MDDNLVNNVMRGLWKETFPNKSFDEARMDGAPSPSADVMSQLRGLAKAAIEAVNSYKHPEMIQSGDVCIKPENQIIQTQNLEQESDVCCICGVFVNEKGICDCMHDQGR